MEFRSKRHRDLEDGELDTTNDIKQEEEVEMEVEEAEDGEREEGEDYQPHHHHRHYPHGHDNNPPIKKEDTHMKYD